MAYLVKPFRVGRICFLTVEIGHRIGVLGEQVENNQLCYRAVLYPRICIFLCSSDYLIAFALGARGQSIVGTHRLVVTRSAAP